MAEARSYRIERRFPAMAGEGVQHDWIAIDDIVRLRQCRGYRWCWEATFGGGAVERLEFESERDWQEFERAWLKRRPR